MSRVIGVEFCGQVPNLPEIRQHHVAGQGKERAVQAVPIPDISENMKFHNRRGVPGLSGFFKNGKSDF
jgi:hypothetical protein